MLCGNENEGLMGSINLNRECIVLVKSKSRAYIIILTLVIAFIFPLVLFNGNCDHYTCYTTHPSASHLALFN